jgi:hypothetical protein
MFLVNNFLSGLLSIAALAMGRNRIRFLRVFVIVKMLLRSILAVNTTIVIATFLCNKSQLVLAIIVQSLISQLWIAVNQTQIWTVLTL